MRRMFATAAAGASLFLVTGVSHAQAPALDSVTGQGGQVGNFTFSFDAHSGPSGENPGGRVVWHSGGGWTDLQRRRDLPLGQRESRGDRLQRRCDRDRQLLGGRLGQRRGRRRADDRRRHVRVGRSSRGTRATPAGDPLPGPTDCSSYPGPFPFLNGPVSVGTSGDIAVIDAPGFSRPRRTSARTAAGAHTACSRTRATASASSGTTGSTRVTLARPRVTRLVLACRTCSRRSSRSRSRGCRATRSRSRWTCAAGCPPSRSSGCRTAPSASRASACARRCSIRASTSRRSASPSTSRPRTCARKGRASTWRSRSASWSRASRSRRRR